MSEFVFKKKFGQNFISDKNLLQAIVNDAGIGQDDYVLEIGAGAGSLTQVLAKQAKKVLSFEIDKDLEDVLRGLNLQNVQFVFQDFMDVDMPEIEKEFFSEKEKPNFEKTTKSEKLQIFDEKCKKNAKKMQKHDKNDVFFENKTFKVVANLPYYITTPIIFKLLEESEHLSSLTIMVQKEVAQRVCANAGGKDYGILSVMTNFYGKAKITRIIGRQNFYPVPNVDSALLHIEIENLHKNVDRKSFSEFVKTCFSMRRKTLLNNLSTKFSKDVLKEKLGAEILSRRAETFSLDELLSIFQSLK